MGSGLGTSEDSNGVYSKFPEPLPEIIMSIGFREFPVYTM